jgi:hypothetical protein
MGPGFSRDIKANREAIHRSAEGRSEARRAKRPKINRLSLAQNISPKFPSKNACQAPNLTKRHKINNIKMRISYARPAKIELER